MEICSRCIPFAFKQRKSKSIRFRCFIFVLTACLTCVNGFANELVELGTVGKTKSTEQYYENLSFRDSKVDPSKLTGLINKARDSISHELFFPLVPGTLKPGITRGYKFEKPKAIKPFAVIGIDPLSMKWLKFRLDKLIELNAPIYVVQAESFQNVRKLAGAFSKLKFVPSSGDGIGKELKVGAYPFLVTSNGVFQ